MPNRRTALFIGINQRYVNPTNALLPAVVQKFCDVHFFGPGFVSPSTLEQGVERYVDAIGGADLIVATSQCLAGSSAARLERFMRRYTVLLNGGEVTQSFLNDAAAFCRRNRQRVLCALTDLDPHAVQQATLDRLLEHAGYFMCWGQGFIGTLHDGEAVSNEEYMRKKVRKGLELGLFDGFVDDHRRQIINLGHLVADTEFYWGNLATRRYDVAVPGSRYARRKGMLNALSRVKGMRIPALGYRYLYQMAERLALRPYANFYLVHLYSLAFQRAISQCKMCVTDGGANNYPVRKFFEIPAAGSLMVCWPSLGIESLGFRDGENCIFVRDQDEVVRTIHTVLRDVDRFEAIAAAGRELVFRQHSVSARAAQLHDAINSIDAGTFVGSAWHDGTFRCAPDSGDVRVLTRQRRDVR